MKIYTKKGDGGLTSLFGGQKVSKDHIRVEAYGNVDELNSYLGLLRDLIEDSAIKNQLLKIQNELFVIGSKLATPPAKEKLLSKNKTQDSFQIDKEQISFLENMIDSFEKELKPMTHFILPGGHAIVSHCHIARNICRRAERRVVHLAHGEPVEETIIKYLNRLSDYLFVLARKLSKILQIDEIKWIP